MLNPYSKEYRPITSILNVLRQTTNNNITTAHNTMDQLNIITTEVNQYTDLRVGPRLQEVSRKIEINQNATTLTTTVPNHSQHTTDTEHQSDEEESIINETTELTQTTTQNTKENESEGEEVSKEQKRRSKRP
jgi:neutral trehalase